MSVTYKDSVATLREIAMKAIDRDPSLRSIYEGTGLLDDDRPLTPPALARRRRLGPVAGEPAPAAPAKPQGTAGPSPAQAGSAVAEPGGADEVSRTPQTPTHSVRVASPNDLPSLDERTLASSTVSPIRVPHGPARQQGETAPVNVLAIKVDSLYISFHAKLPRELIRGLDDAKEALRKGLGPIYVTVGGVIWKFELGASGPRHPFRLSNEFASLGISKTESKNVPALKFQLRSRFLWEFEAKGGWLWAEGLAKQASSSGEVRAVLSRVDQCVDVTGPDFSLSDLEEFLVRARKITRHRCADGDRACEACGGTGKESGEPTGEHFSGRTLTGYSFGKSEVAVRIYDKTREIREQSPDKAWLYPVWARNGWVGGERVWRIELQLRREALKSLVSRETAAKLDLDELGSPEERDVVMGGPEPGPGDLAAFTGGAVARRRVSSRLVRPGFLGALGSLWTYVMGGKTGHTAWISWRHVSGTDRKRSNWKIRDQWRAIQAVKWDKFEPEPLLRFKARAAAYAKLLPQLAGLAATVAALKGPNINGRAPMLHELEPDIREHLARKGTNWETSVNEKRVLLALWDLVDLEQRETDLRRAKAIAATLAGKDDVKIAKRAWKAALSAADRDLLFG